jgi:hypothetical protein
MNNVDNVRSLPPTITYTVEQALQDALQYAQTSGLKDVLIIGEEPNGVLFIRSSRMTRKDALWLAERSRLYSLGIGD